MITTGSRGGGRPRDRAARRVAPTNATFRIVGRGDVDGTPARRIADTDGGTVSVSVDGPLRLLQIGSEQGEFRFSHPTDQVSVTAPDDPLPFPG